MLELWIILLLFTSTPKTIDIPFLEGSVQIDGVIDESIWQSACKVEDFGQIYPKIGEEPSFNTRVYLFTDGEFLYIGAYLYDKEPQKIVHQQIRRDSDLSLDDNFSVYLDTYHDKKKLLLLYC